MPFVYHKQETAHTCGPAAFRMALEHFGIKESEEYLARLLKTKKYSGTRTRYFPPAAKKYDLTSIVKINGKIADLKKLQKDGFAVILYYYCPQGKFYHYSVLRKIGQDYIYLLDPWHGPKEKYLIDFFKKVWKSDPRYENEKGWLFAVKK